LLWEQFASPNMVHHFGWMQAIKKKEKRFAISTVIGIEVAHKKLGNVPHH